MKGYIANTDYDWYSFLWQHPELEEVNFWMPRDTRRFQAVPVGAPFFFKLKARYGHAIVGFAYFVRWTVLPAWLAWDTFEEGNGAASFEEMTRRISRYRGERDPLGKFDIGCLLLAEPIFFSEQEWVQGPRDWRPTIVQGKGYDLAAGEGRRIWLDCYGRAQERRLEDANDGSAVARDRASSAGSGRGRGAPALIRPRLGQGVFRISVIDAYHRACAVSTEHSLPVLEAAHIRPFADSEDNRVENGICLRADIHRLFDRGYVTVTRDHHFLVSRHLRQDYENGRIYYHDHGRRITLPADRREWPSRDALIWHNENRFVG